jgi:hypothetical protein
MGRHFSIFSAIRNLFSNAIADSKRSQGTAYALLPGIWSTNGTFACPAPRIYTTLQMLTRQCFTIFGHFIPVNWYADKHAQYLRPVQMVAFSIQKKTAALV